MNVKKSSLLLLLLSFVLACQTGTGFPAQTPPAMPTQKVDAPPVPTVQASAPTEESALAYERKDVSPAPDKFSLVKIVGNGAPLDEILYAEAQKAFELGLNPFVDFYADWCPPCRAIDANIGNELMIDAFTGTYIIQLDFDEWKEKITDAGFYVVGIPAYYEVDVEGRSTGRMITGGAWGEDVAENIAPPLKAFFTGE